MCTGMLEIQQLLHEGADGEKRYTGNIATSGEMVISSPWGINIRIDRVLNTESDPISDKLCQWTTRLYNGGVHSAVFSLLHYTVSNKIINEIEY